MYTHVSKCHIVNPLLSKHARRVRLCLDNRLFMEWKRHFNEQKTTLYGIRIIIVSSLNRNDWIVDTLSYR